MNVVFLNRRNFSESNFTVLLSVCDFRQN